MKVCVAIDPVSFLVFLCLLSLLQSLFSRYNGAQQLDDTTC